jgi:protein-S-isoprenylcysteine O-methyltransferase Ste14
VSWGLMNIFKKFHDWHDPEVRKDLAGEHPLNDFLQFVLLIIFLAVWTTDSFFLKFSTFLSNYVSIYIRAPLGILILFLAIYLSRQGMKIMFIEERAAPVVVRKGPFGIVRHPIYLAVLLIYFGLTAITFSLAGLVLAIVAIFFYNFEARYEEKLLLAKFGKDYEKYMTEVPRWLPRLLK